MTIYAIIYEHYKTLKINKTKKKKTYPWKWKISTWFTIVQKIIYFLKTQSCKMILLQKHFSLSLSSIGFLNAFFFFSFWSIQVLFSSILPCISFHETATVQHYIYILPGLTTEREWLVSSIFNNNKFCVC